MINPVSKYATLVVISPEHGQLDCVWEKKGLEGMDDAYLPYNTSVLYVQSTGTYQCTGVLNSRCNMHNSICIIGHDDSIEGTLLNNYWGNIIDKTIYSWY